MGSVVMRSCTVQTDVLRGVDSSVRNCRSVSLVDTRVQGRRGLDSDLSGVPGGPGGDCARSVSALKLSALGLRRMRPARASRARSSASSLATCAAASSPTASLGYAAATAARTPWSPSRAKAAASAPPAAAGAHLRGVLGPVSNDFAMLDRSLFLRSPKPFIDQHGERLRSLVGEHFEASWIAWDTATNEWWADEAIVLRIGGHQLEVVCFQLDQVALTWGEIDTAQPPRHVADWGDARGEGKGPPDGEWVLHGLELEFSSGLVRIFNALDENGLEGDPREVQGVRRISL